MRVSPYRAYQVGLEILAGTLVGAVFGYFIDCLLASSPWGLIIFIVLGAISGFRNLVRSAQLLLNLPPQRKKDD